MPDDGFSQLANPEVEPAPTLTLMHAAFVLAGLGTLLLGPILPLLSARWHLNDSQSGLLILAQFAGATLGGSTVSSRLQSGLRIGLFAGVFGFFAFALAPGLLIGCLALLIAGFGTGRTVAAVNIIAGNRFTQGRASALSWLNFSWSFGALLSPLSAAWLASRFLLPHLLTAFSALWLTAAATLLLQMRARPQIRAQNQSQNQPKASQAAAATASLKLSPFLLFAALLVVYGGLETSLGAWLTTYSLRSGSGSLALGQYITVLLLCGLTAGRALAAVLLKRIAEATLQRLSLLIAAGLIAALAAAHGPGLLAVLAILLGITLAPIFPATFAIVMAAKPSASQAGIILAASGIGAATLPALIGLVSTHTGSLRIALFIPAAAALVMLALTLLQPARGAQPAMISEPPPGV